MNQIRISLDETDFKKMVSGGIVEKKVNNTVIKIIVQDIGYLQMMQIIEDLNNELNG